MRTIGADEKASVPQLLIVDGQQRLTSLYAVTKGLSVVRNDFSTEPIRIAFHPLEERFEVLDAGIKKSAEYIHDVSEVWNTSGGTFKFISTFVGRLRAARAASLREDSAREVTPEEEDKIAQSIGRLFNLTSYPFTALQLLASVSEEKVAEIFVRINSKATPLNQADFILTLMSVYWDEGRTAVERFCRESRKPSQGKPSPYNHLIQPDPDQLLRVSVALGFRRARLQHAYSILRGKDLDSGEFSDVRREEQFCVLERAQGAVLNIQNWHDFLWCVKGAGYRRSSEIISETALLYSYALYLLGKRDFGVNHADLRRVIMRWFFMAALTARYTTSHESTMEQDLSRLRDVKTPAGFCQVLDSVVRNTLTPDYWNITLPQQLATQAARSPSLYAFYAALCILDAKALFSNLKMAELFSPDIHATVSAVERHHLFPKAYLKANGITEQRDINQLANYAWLEWKDNRAILDQAPSAYFPSRIKIFGEAERRDFCYWHALPQDWENLDYHAFLSERRRLMAGVIRDAYQKLWT